MWRDIIVVSGCCVLPGCFLLNEKLRGSPKLLEFCVTLDIFFNNLSDEHKRLCIRYDNMKFPHAVITIKGWLNSQKDEHTGMANQSSSPDQGDYTSVLMHP